MQISDLSSISTCATYSWIEGWQRPEAAEPHRPEDMPYFQLQNGIINARSINGTGAFASNDVFFEPAFGCFFQVKPNAAPNFAPPCGSLVGWKLVRREVALEFAGTSTLYVTTGEGTFKSVPFTEVCASEQTWQSIADAEGVATLGLSGVVYYPVEVPMEPEIVMTPGPTVTEIKVDRGACLASGVLGALISPIITGGNHD